MTIVSRLVIGSQAKGDLTPWRQPVCSWVKGEANLNTTEGTSSVRCRRVLRLFVGFYAYASLRVGPVENIATQTQILYNFRVEYPFPPVGIVGAADGKNRRAFLFPSIASLIKSNQ